MAYSISSDYYEGYKNEAYKFHEPDTSITMNCGADEMLRVTKDSFYVRGVKVTADKQEAEVVYNAFKQWLAWANLQQQR